MSKKFVIYRGVPGSGKTYDCKRRFPNATVCSAVDFHTDADGIYRFNETTVKNSHSYCKLVFKKAIKEGDPLIVLENTNTKVWHFEEYIKEARKAGYEVVVLRMRVDDIDIDVVAWRNIHDVPLDKVRLMHEIMEDYPGEIYI